MFGLLETKYLNKEIIFVDAESIDLTLNYGIVYGKEDIVVDAENENLSISKKQVFSLGKFSSKSSVLTQQHKGLNVLKNYTVQ
jgi:hypothetical protein